MTQLVSLLFSEWYRRIRCPVPAFYKQLKVLFLEEVQPNNVGWFIPSEFIFCCDSVLLGPCFEVGGSTYGHKISFNTNIPLPPVKGRFFVNYCNLSRSWCCKQKLIINFGMTSYLKPVSLKLWNLHLAHPFSQMKSLWFVFYCFRVSWPSVW